MGIICKTVAQAKALHEALSGALSDARPEAGAGPAFLGYDSTAFGGGIVITSAHIAKGLESDTVIVPDVGDTD